MPHRWLLVLAAILAAALALLGILQYRWIDEVSIAQERRERGEMELAARRFADDVDRELNRAVVAFQGAQVDSFEIAHRYSEWASSTRDPRLISAIYTANANEIQQFVPREGQLVETTWPPNLSEVRELLATLPPGAAPNTPGRRPLIDDVPALLLPMRPQPRRPPPDFERPVPPQDGRPPRPEDDAAGFGGPPPRDNPGPPPPQFLIAVLDRNYLANDLFPELARNAFPRGETDLAVLDADQIVFRTNAAWPRSASDVPEVAVPLMSSRPPQERDPGASRWRVVVRRHGVSLADTVASSRLRNLMLAFAILLLLAVSFALVAVLARRADRLRRQQLEFVAGITHELNTPLAALSSAGQNLADGIVAEPPQVAKYGAMIVRESRRLIDMVGQVLDFAGIQARSGPRRVETVDVPSLIDDAVAHCRWLAEEAGVKLETQIANDLPSIDGDPSALERAVQNLVANAIRHGGEGAWVGIRAERSNGAVAITVEDHGRGIAPRDLPHLFEPFYRGRDASRVRGTGLGLTIVHEIAAAHGGNVEVARRRQRGAAFTLRIPAGQHG